MADPVDIGNDRAQQLLDAAIHAARGEIKPGARGECDLCGEHSMRLIEGACAPCRDKYHLA